MTGYWLLVGRVEFQSICVFARVPSLDPFIPNPSPPVLISTDMQIRLNIQHSILLNFNSYAKLKYFQLEHLIEGI